MVVEMRVVVAKDLMKANDQIARTIRAQFDRSGVYAVNLLGSPGSGKTTTVEALLPTLMEKMKVGVIEGDLATARDAERIEAAGAPAVQINTNGACHLNANMVGAALESIALDALNLLFIENVGNLVCTAGFALGEHLRVVVLSVTEGDDKVEKYPPIFQSADAVFLNKIDLLAHTDFDAARVENDLRRISPAAGVFPISARTGEGIDRCAAWLVEKRIQWLANHTSKG
jgi:hydrogenase nickel incorporation protein HypB